MGTVTALARVHSCVVAQDTHSSMWNLKTDIAHNGSSITPSKFSVQHFSFVGLLTHFEAEKEEKKQVQSEVKQLQDKLHRKQESLLQLQEEKEKLYTESR